VTEIMLQHLIGKRVFDSDGKPVGRIEEVVAEASGTELLVKEYHVGAFALIERLSAGEIGRTILRLLGAVRGQGLAVPWDRMDLSSMKRPQITCRIEELRPPRSDVPHPF
jgi:sporulation protein YlmC with PRC-barrel domain